ncbi:amidohydrolase 2 [Rickenella mellea]|uniref:Amidohydrolase 2 n=1 Tax=Rickenella mellea TaxID=50990 RepID=A0A4Y7Q9R2_9AGAM|nr:amidohydrolase 2 [Rickenella mellea]
MVWLLSPYVFICICMVQARKWNNTGKGSIVLEEAWTIPEFVAQASVSVPPPGQTTAQLEANLLDIHNQRLAAMDLHGIDFMVLSCAAPCIQGISDPNTAATFATKVNDELASAIANNTMRFGGFASLSMHDPAAAAKELNRTVFEHGFLGALLNDYQQSGPDNTTLLYYDQPEYDVFWSMAETLDVPVYLHPRFPIAQITALEYAHSPFILGPVNEFQVTLSNHILGIIANGVFDRFPRLKFIVGHLGERIPSDLVRIDEHISRQKSRGLPMLKNASDYWRSNIFETTSGNFATPLLKFHADAIGLDRILFSIDYPFETISEGTNWLDTIPLSAKDKLRLAREGAIELLKLNH